MLQTPPLLSYCIDRNQKLTLAGSPFLNEKYYLKANRVCRRNIDIDGKHCSHSRSCTFPIITRSGIVANCRHYSRALTSARLFSC